MPLDSTKRYCKSCGDRKRLTWPKGDPVCCTMTCAANKFLIYVATASNEWDGSHCTNCGSLEEHYVGDWCDHEVDEGEA